MQGMIGKFVVNIVWDKSKRVRNWSSIGAYEIVAVLNKRTVLGRRVWLILWDDTSRGDDDGIIEEITCNTERYFQGWDLLELELFPEPEKVRKQQYKTGNRFEYYIDSPPMGKWRRMMINCHRTTTNRLFVTVDYDDDNDTGTVDIWEGGAWRTEKWVNGVNTTATPAVESN